MTTEHVIEHSSQLSALGTLPGFHMPEFGRVRLGGSMAQLERREYWERELNRHYFACGCGAGATGLLIGLLVGASSVAVSAVPGEGFSVSWKAALLALGGALVGAVVGKLTGLLWAQRRLRALIRQIHSAAAPHESRSPVLLGAHH